MIDAAAFRHATQRDMGQHAVGGCFALVGQGRIGLDRVHCSAQVVQIVVDHRQMLRRDSIACRPSRFAANIYAAVFHPPRQ